MKTLKIKLKHNSYPVFLDKNSISYLPDFLKKNKIGDKYAIITDEKVKNLFGKQLCAFLKKNNIKCEIFSFPIGENSKKLKTIENLAEKILNKNFNRKDAIIALGGGVSGDLAGFLSSIFMRGIPYIQIPTTLLATVDSAVGGKAGVNFKKGKNLLGTFHHPKAVFINLEYLKNLPEKQIKNGLAEVIKYGIIQKPSLFNFIEQNYKEILTLKEKPTIKIIKDSLNIKANIIKKDEKEKKNIRIKLNYGHTYGHAIEKLSKYTLLHGYAVSIGMVIANKIAVKNNLLKQKDAERIKNLLRKIGLPTTTMHKPKKADIINDKKAEKNHINLIVPTKIGKVKIHKLQL